MASHASRSEKLAVVREMRTAARQTGPSRSSQASAAAALKARSPAAAGKASRPGQTATATPALSTGALWTIAAAMVALATLVAGALLLGSRLDSDHSVAGMLLLDQQPLEGVDVAFQPKLGQDSYRVRTGIRGAFQIDDLPAGDYVIFLVPSDPAVRVPSRYLAPESTPFRLNLSKDRSDLRMLAVSK